MEPRVPQGVWALGASPGSDNEMCDPLDNIIRVHTRSKPTDDDDDDNVPLGKLYPNKGGGEGTSISDDEDYEPIPVRLCPREKGGGDVLEGPSSPSWLINNDSDAELQADRCRDPDSDMSTTSEALNVPSPPPRFAPLPPGFGPDTSRSAQAPPCGADRLTASRIYEASR